MEHPRGIVIVDFGGHYAHLIASRIRRMGAYAEIKPPETPLEEFRNAAGIILSGGPQSVYEKGSPQADPGILALGIPVLGLCYGLHWMTQALGGEVKPGKVKEYGKTPIRVVEGGGDLLRDCTKGCTVWMSHGDEAAKLPDGFTLTATSDACKHAAFADASRKLFAFQFHPEVTHTEHGEDMLRRFVALCDAEPWSIESYAEHISAQIKREVGDRKVFMLVSGGVDSTVAFTLLNKVLGQERVQGLLVDTGLMRKHEVASIQEAFKPLRITNLRIEDASNEFFTNLKEVYDPEEKRRIIGNTFLAVQKRVSEEMGLTAAGGWMLGQGTIYPDTIETGATKHADKIKTHHNRVEAVQQMIEQGLVIEPLKDLYKDEVRRLGEELGLPHELVWRHPFPGPGLGVRILCAAQPETIEQPAIQNAKFSSAVLPIKSVGVQGDGRTYRHALAFFTGQSAVPHEMLTLATTIPNTNREVNRVLVCTSQSTLPEFVFSPGYLTRERADLLREADAIVDAEMRGDAGLYQRIWQFPVVLLPFGTSEGGQSIVLRPIESIDAMTASAASLPPAILRRMTERILSLQGIDLVFLDLTSKPPGTIEWE
ncbi:MAG: glutamine-hydrolyzing GMP synthase [Candidatus Peribacteraceae bacterium]|nr:glutamine-hydrolyzing GMP synthase [Candidatus Peribacteraceae bacterium]